MVNKKVRFHESVEEYERLKRKREKEEFYNYMFKFIGIVSMFGILLFICI